LLSPHKSFAEGVYTGFINLLPTDFVLPSVGIINIICGDYGSVELGGINVVEGTLSGAQAGLINITGQNMKGAQIGFFLNSNIQDMTGMQIGSVNMTNMDSGIFTGMQLGIVNTGSRLTGAQIGLASYVGGFVEGLQIGGFNVINGSLSGIQLGLFNYVESVDSGASIGILSVVRDSGYFALETSYSNLAADIRLISGLEHLYSSFSLAVGIPGISIFSTFGIGSTIYPFRYFFIDFLCFVPEIRFSVPLITIYPETVEPVPVLELLEEGIFPFLFAAVPKIGFNLGKRIMISAGPIFGIDHASEYISPSFSFISKNIGGDYRFISGFEASFRWILSD
jgi:hypothetical protein